MLRHRTPIAGMLGAAMLLFGLVVLPQAAQAAVYSPPVSRERIDLNASWRFHLGDVPNAQAAAFDDSSWARINVPHTWNAADGADGGNNYRRDVGWYRRHYTAPASLAGRKLHMQFAGANQVADVWINGSHIGQHRGGFARFRFDVTSVLRVGQENVIAVKVDNRFNADIAPISIDATLQGGIYRNVSLWAADPLMVRMTDYAGPGVYLRQRAVSVADATIDVTTKVWNNNTTSRSVTVRAVITDASGTIVADQTAPVRTIAATSGADFMQSVTITNPRRWNGVADPYMYRANVEVRDASTNRVTDVVTEPLGIRSYSLNPSTGFMLNGDRLHLHGVNIHQDRAGKGWAINNDDHVQDFALIRELGANAVRLAHYQHDQKSYEIADSSGLILWTEIPLVNAVTASAAFTANAQQQLRELIRQNYNHPSVIFWGIGNEQRTDNAATNALLDSLAGVVAAEDPDRISAYAHCCTGDTSAVAGHAETTGYNIYHGWYPEFGNYNQLGPWADRVHAALPSRAIGVSEYGAGANVNQHELNPAWPSPGGQWHPEEYQSLLHEAAWKQLSARPYIWGTFMWVMFDFASDGRNEGAQPGINDKGLMTRDRATRKDAFYFYKANWSSSAVVHLTSKRWTDRTATAAAIKVYSNRGVPAATLNGLALGAPQNLGANTYQWNVTLRTGANAVSVTAGGLADSATWTVR